MSIREGLPHDRYRHGHYRQRAGKFRTPKPPHGGQPCRYGFGNLMQKIAAYLIERRDGMNHPEARVAEAGALRACVNEWIKKKGATDIGPSGTYKAEDGSAATFLIQDASDGERSWWMARLDEVSTVGRRFSAAVSITNVPCRVAVYVTMEVGAEATGVAPLKFEPRTPHIIRTLLKREGPWYHGTSEVHRLRRANGRDSGDSLAAELKHVDRTLPVIVVSTLEGNLALPDLDVKLADDLAGLADVVVVDAEASWALTDRLGEEFTCYWGAVRVYWPRLSLVEDPFRHPRWTAQRLRDAGPDPKKARERFRQQLRQDIMRASALSVVRPREIDDIRGAANRNAFSELRAKAISLADYQELAKLYAADNDELRLTNDRLKVEISALQDEVTTLERDKAALKAHLSAKFAVAHANANEITPEGAVAEETESDPQPGEVRFYKKFYDGGSYDILNRMTDCGHNHWETSHAADKARKGVAKLEGGRTDWKSMQHCASCTGGGMWRVRW